MYNTESNVIFGFHGCDESVMEKLLSGKEIMDYSENPYDWLGKGMYFWENYSQRAMEWAKASSKIKNPSVIGAAISLGNCFDLLRRENLDKLQNLYNFYQNLDIEIPKNKGKEFKLRYADCYLINNILVHESKKGNIFDSVRGVFWEGEELYPNAGFRKQNHIQISIINPNCIKGFFVPREKEIFKFDNFLK